MLSLLFKDHVQYNLMIGYLFLVDNISSQLKLHRYHTGRESRVVTALTLLKSHLFR
ncbi:putative proteasome endopeptidase complex [Helianthus anomalus]